MHRCLPDVGSRKEYQVSSYQYLHRWDARTFFPSIFSGRMRPCPLGMEKKFRFLLYFRGMEIHRGQSGCFPTALLGLDDRCLGITGYSRCKHWSKAWQWQTSAKLGCCVTTCSLTPGSLPGRWLCQQVACSLCSIVPGEAEKFPVLEQGQHELSTFWATLCCKPGTGLSSCLAPLATCFQPPRNATLIGLCENQVLQQWKHWNK